MINQCDPMRPKGASGGNKVSASRGVQASEARLLYLKQEGEDINIFTRIGFIIHLYSQDPALKTKCSRAVQRKCAYQK